MLVKPALSTSARPDAPKKALAIENSITVEIKVFKTALAFGLEQEGAVILLSITPFKCRDGLCAFPSII